VDGFERCVAFQMLKSFGEHDLRALVHGKTGDAGADGGKRNGFEVAFGGKAKGVGGGGAKGFRCGAHAAEAHAGCVDHVAGFEFAAAGNGGVADRDAANFVALALDRFAAFSGDGASHAGPKDEVVVSGIDDGVDVHFGEVALLNQDAVDGRSHAGSL